MIGRISRSITRIGCMNVSTKDDSPWLEASTVYTDPSSLEKLEFHLLDKSLIVPLMSSKTINSSSHDVN